jgi:hypothetical protein
MTFRIREERGSSLWKRRFRIYYGPVVRQSTWWWKSSPHQPNTTQVYYNFLLLGVCYMFRHVHRPSTTGYWRKEKSGIDVTQRRGRKLKKLLDDLKESRGYSNLKEEALDRTMWRARFGRGLGPVVRQTTKWMNVLSPSTGLSIKTLTTEDTTKFQMSLC